MSIQRWLTRVTSRSSEKVTASDSEEALVAVLGKAGFPDYSGDERRRQRRFPVPLWASSLALLGHEGQETEPEECRILEVSRSGLRIRTAAPPRPGDECRLCLRLDEPELGSALVRVRVRWVRALENGCHDAGVEVIESNRRWFGPRENETGGPSLHTPQAEGQTNHLKQDRELAGQRLSELLTTEHWLGDFISVLLSSHELNSGIDFPTAEKLLATEKAEFEHDLTIARRMYRLYPKQTTGERGFPARAADG